MNRLVQLILARPKTMLALLALATVAVGSAAPRTRFDPSVESFIMENDEDYAFYQLYRETFGQDDLLLIAFEDERLFSTETLGFIRRLTRRLEAVDNVFDVKSLSNAQYMRGTEDSFDAVDLVGANIPTEPAILHATRELAVGNRLLQNDIVSLDGRKTALVVVFRAMPGGYLYENEIREIERIVREEATAANQSLHVIGERLVDMRFLEYIYRDIRVFLPVTYLMLMGFLLLVFRNLRFMLIALAAVSLCLVWMAGLVPLAGLEMNSVNAGLPTLIQCIAVTDVIHILHRYRRVRQRMPDRRTALGVALREVAWPCFLTSLTTAVGFGALTLNRLRPIRGFGLLAALGMAACFVVCIVSVPCLILLTKEKPETVRRQRSFVPRPFFTALARLLCRRPRAIALCAAGLFVLAGLGIARIRVQTDRTTYLRSGSDVRQALDFVERNLVGTQQLDIWIETGEEDRIKDPAVLRTIEDLAEFLRAQPAMAVGGKVISINDFFKEMNQAFHAGDPASYTLPETRAHVAQYLEIYGMSGRKNELDKYVDYPYSRARLSVRTAEHNSAQLAALIADVQAWIDRHVEPPLTARIASTAITYNNVFDYLLAGLVQGLGISLLLIGLVMCASFRSWRVGLVGMIPNVLPIAAALGVMGWIGLSLEVATAMTFSIALGIAVDDTIHFLARFRLERATAPDAAVAMTRTLENIGSALVETTTVIVGGFLVFVFASLRMNMIFGLLCAFVMVCTLLTDLVVTPLCVLFFQPFANAKNATDIPAEPATSKWKLENGNWKLEKKFVVPRSSCR